MKASRAKIFKGVSTFVLEMISAINHVVSAVLGAVGLGHCPVVSNLWIFSYSCISRLDDYVPRSNFNVRVCVCAVQNL